MQTELPEKRRVAMATICLPCKPLGTCFSELANSSKNRVANNTEPKSKHALGQRTVLHRRLEKKEDEKKIEGQREGKGIVRRAINPVDSLSRCPASLAVEVGPRG